MHVKENQSINNLPNYHNICRHTFAIANGRINRKSGTFVVVSEVLMCGWPLKNYLLLLLLPE